MSDEVRNLLSRYYREVWEAGNVEALDDLLGHDYVDHDPSPGFGRARRLPSSSASWGSFPAPGQDDALSPERGRTREDLGDVLLRHRGGVPMFLVEPSRRSEARRRPAGNAGYAGACVPRPAGTGQLTHTCAKSGGLGQRWAAPSARLRS